MKQATIQQKFSRCSTCNLRALSIFSVLDHLGALELEGLLQRLVYPKGFVLYLGGQKPRGVYCVCSGRVKLYLHSYDGRNVVLGHASAGSVIGMRAVLSGKPHDLTAKTVEESQLSFIDKEDFMDLIKRNGHVCLRIAETLGNELSKTYEDFRNVTLAQPYQRLASLLLRLCDDFGEPTAEGIVIKQCVSQEDMAEMTGMSRRTLSRAIQRLKRMEIITCERLTTTVRDKLALRNLLT
ncbi:MAG: Crp/Fnr family transcriptional regulator [Thermodesulfobacteriota bacterium]